MRNHRVRVHEMVKTLKDKIAEPLQSSHQKAEGVNYQKRKLRRKLAREHLAAMIEHDLVFPAKTGTPISPHNLGIREMTRACEKAGLPHHSIYSLRHTMATIALAEGADIKADIRSGIRFGNDLISFQSIFQPFRCIVLTVIATDPNAVTSCVY